MNPLISFVLYGNDYCHLCHDMMNQLKEFCNDYQLNYHLEFIELDDIESTHPTLYEEYELKIPVLLIEQQEICHYFLDIEKLKIALNIK